VIVTAHPWTLLQEIGTTVYPLPCTMILDKIF
jgi:hypothetical protein